MTNLNFIAFCMYSYINSILSWDSNYNSIKFLGNEYPILRRTSSLFTQENSSISITSLSNFWNRYQYRHKIMHKQIRGENFSLFWFSILADYEINAMASWVSFERFFKIVFKLLINVIWSLRLFRYWAHIQSSSYFDSTAKVAGGESSWEIRIGKIIKAYLGLQ